MDIPLDHPDPLIQKVHQERSVIVALAKMLFVDLPMWVEARINRKSERPYEPDAEDKHRATGRSAA